MSAKRAWIEGDGPPPPLSRTIRVQVSAECIADGTREDYEYCPVSLAIRCATGATKVFTDPSQRSVTSRLDAGGGAGWEWSARLPPRICAWIDDFDDGHPMKPTSFLLTIMLSNERHW